MLKKVSALTPHSNSISIPGVHAILVFVPNSPTIQQILRVSSNLWLCET